MDTNLHEYVINLRRKFHQYPELGFNEYQTSEIICTELEKMGVDFKRGIGGTGVIGYLGEGHPHIAFRAEMDALPISENNEITDYASKNPGKMHACGHDAHMSAMLGLALLVKEYSNRNQLTGKVSFIFQPCEETKNENGVSGAQLMNEEAALSDVDAYFAAHVESTLESGKVYIREGSVTAAIDRFDIDVIGKAGHGAYPHKAVDPIWLSANIISLINSIIPRRINTNSPSVLSICSINGGNAWNIIPEKVSLSGTIRTFDQKVREQLHCDLENCLKSTISLGGNYSLKIEKGNPTVINDKTLCDHIRKCVERILGVNGNVGIELQMGGDDFSYYSLKRPSCYFYIGAKKDSVSRQHHSSNFDINEEMIPVYTQLLFEIVKSYRKLQL